MQNKKGSLWEFLQSYLKSLKKLRSCFMKHLVLRLEGFANWGKISFFPMEVCFCCRVTI